MRVHVERRWDRNSVRVYVLLNDLPGQEIALTIPESGTLRNEPIKDGELMPVLFELPVAVFEAICNEGMGVAAPSRAQTDHLSDAVGVRDRLLALVEYTIKES